MKIGGIILATALLAATTVVPTAAAARERSRSRSKPRTGHGSGGGGIYDLEAHAQRSRARRDDLWAVAAAFESEGSPRVEAAAAELAVDRSPEAAWGLAATAAEVYGAAAWAWVCIALAEAWDYAGMKRATVLAPLYAKHGAPIVTPLVEKHFTPYYKPWAKVSVSRTSRSRAAPCAESLSCCADS